ncbi:MAG: thioredoxin [Bacteroidales bacterium]|jgi:thioredoxin 1|nr:thioredoxin [Bacteroidales bacterium]MCK9499988.1 thioredoxin [Bacteroidales bacterium]MDY0315370.1 thioredoxin [Bacteroidales bacterium]
MKIAILIISGVLVLFIAYLAIMASRLRKANFESDSDKIKILNDKNFNFQIKSGITLVDFWAPWCMPCKMMIPILNELAESDKHNVNIAKLNVDENPQISAKNNVRNIPTTIIFKDGKEVKRIVGVKPANYLLKELQNL